MFFILLVIVVTGEYATWVVVYDEIVNADSIQSLKSYLTVEEVQKTGPHEGRTLSMYYTSR